MHRSAALPVLAIVAFLGAADSTVVAAILPALLRDLHVPFTDLDHAAWIVTAYLLGYVAALPISGPLSDRFGRRPVLLAALALFALGSLGCLLAADLTTLDIARGVQATGGGALLPAGLATIGDLSHHHRRGLALGILAAAAELGSVCGPPIGTAMTALGGWRAIFLLNVPLTLLLGAAVWLILPPGKQTRPTFDAAGGLILAAALAAFAVATNSGGGLDSTPTVSGSPSVSSTNGTQGWRELAILICGGLLILLWRVERRRADGIIDLHTTASPRFLAAAATNLIVGVALIVVLIDAPVYAAIVLNWKAETAGLVLLWFLLPLSAGSVLGGLWVQRWQSQSIAIIGMACAGLGLWQMSRWTSHLAGPTLALPLIVAGAGLGLVAAPVTTAALSAAGTRAAGTASSLVTAVRVVGMMAGLALLTGWGIIRFHQLIIKIPFPFFHLSRIAAVAHRQIASYEAAINGVETSIFGTIFLVVAILCGVGIVPAFWLAKSN